MFRAYLAGVRVARQRPFRQPLHGQEGERTPGSVANLTGADAAEFLALAPQVPVRTVVRTYPLRAADAHCGTCAGASSTARRRRAVTSHLVAADW